MASRQHALHWRLSECTWLIADTKRYQCLCLRTHHLSSCLSLRTFVGCHSAASPNCGSQGNSSRHNKRVQGRIGLAGRPTSDDPSLPLPLPLEPAPTPLPLEPRPGVEVGPMLHRPRCSVLGQVSAVVCCTVCMTPLTGAANTQIQRATAKPTVTKIQQLQLQRMPGTACVLISHTNAQASGLHYGS